MKNKLFFIWVILLTLGLMLFVVTDFFKKKSIVVVDSQKVIESYEGFKEAKDSYELRVEGFSAEFYQKRKIFESKSKEFEILEKSLNESEKLIKRNNLAKMKEELLKAGTLLEKQTAEEEEKLLQIIFNKVNDFIKRYAREKDYDIILAANGDGNIIYVNDAIDLTSEIIIELNKEYIEGVEN